MIDKRPTCIIKLLDEINVVIIGLKRDEYEYFYEKYGFFAKGHFFNPKFKLGRWDGKIRFFGKNGKTYLQLIPEILPYVRQLGYKFELKDQRSQLAMHVPAITKDYFKDYGLEYADHQIEGINEFTKHHNGTLEMATGAGKSLVMAGICDLYNKNYNLKTLCIVPTVDLVTQTKLEFQSVGLDVGEYSGTVKDLNHPHVISTWQSIINNYEMIKMFNVLIVDEAHEATGLSLQKILNEYGSNIIVRLGLTGTLPKNEADQMTIRTLLGPMRYQIEAKTLMDLGWLAELKIKIYQLEENLIKEWKQFELKNPEAWSKTNYKSFKENEAFPDYFSEKNYLNLKANRNNFILQLVDSIRESEKSNTLILVNNKNIGIKLSEIIPNAIFIHGGDHKDIRKEVYDSFQDKNDLCIIATYKLASRGINIKRIFNLILVDAGKGFTKVIQSIGRSLRKAHDKDYVTAYDICSDLKYSKKHLTERIKFYKEKDYNYTKKLIDYE